MLRLFWLVLCVMGCGAQVDLEPDFGWYLGFRFLGDWIGPKRTCTAQRRRFLQRNSASRISVTLISSRAVNGAVPCIYSGL